MIKFLIVLFLGFGCFYGTLYLLGEAIINQQDSKLYTAYIKISETRESLKYYVNSVNRYARERGL